MGMMIGNSIGISAGSGIPVIVPETPLFSGSIGSMAISYTNPTSCNFIMNSFVTTAPEGLEWVYSDIAVGQYIIIKSSTPADTYHVFIIDGGTAGLPGLLTIDYVYADSTDFVPITSQTAVITSAYPSGRLYKTPYSVSDQGYLDFIDTYNNSL